MRGDQARLPLDLPTLERLFQRVCSRSLSAAISLRSLADMGMT